MNVQRLTEQELARVGAVVGEEYQAGLEPEPDILLPRRIVRAPVGVENARNLLADGPQPAVFELCLDGRSEIVVDFGTLIIGVPEIAFGDGESGEVRIEYGEDLAECLAQSGTPMQKDRAGIRPNTTWSVRKRRSLQFARISVVGTKGTVAIKSFRVVSCLMPIPRLGYFASSDPQLNDIWKAAVRTTHLCMQEYLEDGIKRDCCLWAGDLRPAALTALYVFGTAEYVAHNLRAFIPWCYREGAIPPMVGHQYVMYDYVAWWTIAVYDYFEYSGDTDTVREFFPVVVDQIKFLQKRRTDRGLVDVRLEYDAPFTDWTCTRNREGEVTAQQALYYRMLLDAARLAEAIDQNELAGQWRAEAVKVKVAANAHLWSDELDAFADYVRDGIVSRRTSEDGLCLPVLFDLTDDARARLCLGHLKSAHWTQYGSLHLDRPYEKDEEDYIQNLRDNYIPVMINGYEVAAHLHAGRVADALELLRRCFGNMVGRGATTFWEAMDLDTGGIPSSSVSQCHSWTGMIAQLLQAQVLGVRPASPGFSACVIEPRLAPLAAIKGVVTTPRGLVAVAVEECHAGQERFQKIALSTPAGMPATLVLHPSSERTRVRVNGQLVFSNGQWLDNVGGANNANAIQVPIQPGDHHVVMECDEDYNRSFLPPELQHNLYVKGSLRATQDGFAFTIRCDITLFSLTSLSPVRLDGVEYATYTLSAPVLGIQDAVASETNPVLLRPGQLAEVKAIGPVPQPGKHNIQFVFRGDHGGSINVVVEDAS